MSGARTAVVWGASGGIGRALVDGLVASGAYDVVHAGSRTPIDAASDRVRPFAFDLTDEASIRSATEAIAADGPVGTVLIATGLLHDEDMQPEKSFAALTGDALLAAYRINTIGPALIMQATVPLLPKSERSVVAALSARVGSIGDNRMGGWHSYRASKAALNMVIANLAIELSRSHRQAIAVGLHPGTVATDLSAPFQKRVDPAKLFTPAVSASHLLSVIAGLGTDDTGGVFAWDGQRIPA